MPKFFPAKKCLSTTTSMPMRRGNLLTISTTSSAQLLNTRIPPVLRRAQVRKKHIGGGAPPGPLFSVLGYLLFTPTAREKRGAAAPLHISKRTTHPGFLP